MNPYVKLQNKLDHDLIALRDNVLRLSHAVDRAIDLAFRALTDLDILLAKEIIANDNSINRARNEIEEDCHKILAMQQPTARDMRTIVTMIHIAVELERIADHAAGIAKLTLELEKIPIIAPSKDIKMISQISREMLTASIDAFLNWDVDLAQKTFHRDDEVDALDKRVTHDLIRTMVQNPTYIESGTYLLWITHNLERIADRITNICERVIFMVTGKIPEDIEE